MTTVAMPDTVFQPTLAQKFQAMGDAANAVVLENTVAVSCLVNAFVSRSHTCLIGISGVGKSFLCDTIVGLIDGIPRFFRTQLASGSDAAELLGTYSVPGIREGRFERVTTNRLPESDVAVITEFWRAAPAANDGVLSMMNEGLFYNGGAEPMSADPIVIIDANSMPERGDPRADRVTFWVVIEPIKGRGNLTTMLSDAAERVRATGTTTKPMVTPVITWSEVLRAQAEATQVRISDPTKKALVALFEKLADEGIYPSPRRLVSCLRVLQAEAWLHGRAVTAPEDMTLLSHVLWSEPAQYATVLDLISAVSDPHNAAVLKLKPTVEKLEEAAEEVYQILDPPTLRREAINLHKRVTAVSRTLVEIKAAAAAEGTYPELFDALAARVNAMGRRLWDLVPEMPKP